MKSCAPVPGCGGTQLDGLAAWVEGRPVPWVSPEREACATGGPVSLSPVPGETPG